MNHHTASYMNHAANIQRASQAAKDRADWLDAEREREEVSAVRCVYRRVLLCIAVYIAVYCRGVACHPPVHFDSLGC